MQHLAVLTNLDIAETSRSSINYSVVFQHRREFPTWHAHNRCYGHVEDYGKGPIVESLAVVGTNIPAHIRDHCLLEELTQTLGLLGDACHYRPSLFCDGAGTYDTDLTEADEILLRTLYDPRLKSGMTAAEAMPIARRVIAELTAAAPDK